MVKNRVAWVLRAFAIAVSAVLCSQLSTSAVEEGPFPGLPAVQPPSGGWAGVAQTGMAETARAKQWVRVPANVATSWTYVFAVANPGGDVEARTGLANAVIFVSEAGAEDNYGHMPPLKVRTVAFGAIPVEATVQVSQRRDLGGYPIPIEFRATSDRLVGDLRHLHDTVLKDSVKVRITGLRIDGVDLKLTGRCETRVDASLELHGKGYYSVNPTEDNKTRDWTRYFNPVYGGRLVGTLDLPEFVGCTTAAGDDLSRVLTASVSGADNSVEFQLSEPTCLNKNGTRGLPPAPGESTPEAARCEDIPIDIDYPTR